MEKFKSLIAFNKKGKIENKNLIYIIISIYLELYILQVFSGTFKIFKIQYFIANVLILYSFIFILFSIFKRIKLTLYISNITFIMVQT